MRLIYFMAVEMEQIFKVLLGASQTFFQSPREKCIVRDEFNKVNFQSIIFRDFRQTP